MKKFRLPRKTKKALKGNLWLYPGDEKGNSLMAHPTKYQKDYTALKKGDVRNIIDPKNSRSRRKTFREKLDKENIVSDQELRSYVDDIIREDLRNSSYNTLIEAKHHPDAVKAYYNFVNAYQLYADGKDSYGNICCMAIDRAKELMKERKKIKK
ncbi:hypothetical protein ABWH96_06640 [Marivirga tractuosa]|uniref:hypothetical protein n=1 Tax=Marivirga tractuosa TaxID=1006 RepID=UPI0035CF363A